MRCWQCGAPIRENAQLCVYCGAHQPQAAPETQREGRRRGSFALPDVKTVPAVQHEPRRTPLPRPAEPNVRWRGESEERNAWSALPPEPPRPGTPGDRYSASYAGDPGQSRRREQPQGVADADGWNAPSPQDSYRRSDDDAAGYEQPYWTDQHAAPGRPGSRGAYAENRAQGPVHPVNGYQNGYLDSEDFDAHVNQPDRYTSRSQDPYADSRGTQRHDQPEVRPRRSAPPRADHRQSQPLMDGSFDPHYRGDAPGGLPPLTMERAAFGGKQKRGRRGGRAEDADAGSWQRAVEEVWETSAGSSGDRPLLPGQTRIPADPPRARGSHRRRRGRGGLLAGLVVLLLLVVLVGAGAVLGPHYLRGTKIGSQLSRHVPFLKVQQTPQSAFTPRPLPTVLPGYTQYTDPSSHFALNTPQGWLTRPNDATTSGQPDHTVLFSSKDGASTFAVEQSAIFSSLSDDAVVQGEITPLQQAGDTVTEITPTAAPRTFGGEIWQHHEYEVVVKGTKEHITVYATHHAGKAYAIVLASPANTYATVASGTFEKMLGSYRFTA